MSQRTVRVLTSNQTSGDSNVALLTEVDRRASGPFRIALTNRYTQISMLRILSNTRPMRQRGIELPRIRRKARKRVTTKLSAAISPLLALRAGIETHELVKNWIRFHLNAQLNDWRCGLVSRNALVPSGIWMLCLLVCVCSVLGCNNLKSSEEEPEHSIPAHWPTSMLDAADKIDQRIDKLKIGEVNKDTRDELNDLVEWSPEIAADTDLEESDWDEIYLLSETLREHLASADVPLTDYRQDFSKLSELLREFHQRMSDRQSPMNFASETEKENAEQANEATNSATTSTSEVQ